MEDKIFNYYGEKGVEELKKATPKDTGKTSESWTYKIEKTNDGKKISFINTNEVNGYNVALMIQYGHGTKNGGYVVGRDYINPAVQPIFDSLAYNLWKEVSSL